MDIEKARLFATEAHRGQVRKYTGEPYINHPVEVASIVQAAGGSDAMICAALLHDVVEDCDVGHDAIATEFGAEVSDLVRWLTDKSVAEDGSRVVRKEIDRNHIAAAPSSAQTIKLADLISNTASIVERDPAFAKVYLAEKRLLLPVLTKGDPGLWERANTIAEAG